MATTIKNAVLAVYVSKYGQILATEQLNGEPRDITSNQLEMEPGQRSAEETVLSLELRVELCGGTADAKCGTRYMMMRHCYNQFGREVPCF